MTDKVSVKGIPALTARAWPRPADLQRPAHVAHPASAEHAPSLHASPYSSAALRPDSIAAWPKGTDVYYIFVHIDDE